MRTEEVKKRIADLANVLSKLIDYSCAVSFSSGGRDPLGVAVDECTFHLGRSPAELYYC